MEYPVICSVIGYMVVKAERAPGAELGADAQTGTVRQSQEDDKSLGASHYIESTHDWKFIILPNNQVVVQPFPEMRILIIGGSGQTGSLVIDEALQRGESLKSSSY